jgi:hypothetical protein
LGSVAGDAAAQLDQIAHAIAEDHAFFQFISVEIPIVFWNLCGHFRISGDF